METLPITNREILEIFIKIEREGETFYNELAQRVENPKVKEFLKFLAKEEAMHEVQFRKLIENKGDSSYGWENQDSVRDMMAKQFQTDIFPPLDEIERSADELKVIDKALEFAMDAERISAEFYGMLGEYCEDIEAKTALLQLEKAELDHLEKIQSLKDELLKDSG